MKTNYQIYKKNRKFNNKTFKSYEAARSYVRKHIRANADRLFDTNVMFRDMGWQNHRNPSISLLGFEIRSA